MPLFTGIGLALTALEAAAATAVTAAGTAASGIAAAGVGGASLSAGTAAAGLVPGAGIAASAAAPAAAGIGGLATIGNIATAAGVAGTGVSVAGQLGQMNAQQQAADEQRKQEQLRQKQMQLEADRQRREVIRQTQISQAIGINNAASSGASLPDSSTLQGIVGQNQTNQNYGVNAINQNEAIGNALFSSNARESEYNSTASLFGGIGNIGSSIAQNNMQIGRLTTTLFNG